MLTKKTKSGADKQTAPVSTAKPESNIDGLADNQTEKPNRISFNVKDTGTPDWDRMSPKTREQLTKALQDKSVQKELGILPAFTEEQKADLQFNDDESNGILDGLGGVNAMLAHKIYNVPMEVTSTAFAFNPEQRKKINPKLAKLLNKWGPMVIKTWKDEIGLGIVLLATINAQVRSMHAMEEKRKSRLPRSVTPISEASPQKEAVANPPEMLDNIVQNA